MKWFDIEPRDAVDIDCATRLDLDPPVNESGEVCPWPWEPQQLKGVPMGQYHCEYCGAMCVAGVRHPDYRNLDEGLPAVAVVAGQPGERVPVPVHRLGQVRAPEPAGVAVFPPVGV